MPRVLFVGGPMSGVVQESDGSPVRAIAEPDHPHDDRYSEVVYTPETFVLGEQGLRVMMLDGLAGLDRFDETIKAIAAALDLEALTLPASGPGGWPA